MPPAPPRVIRTTAGASRSTAGGRAAPIGLQVAPHVVEIAGRRQLLERGARRGPQVDPPGGHLGQRIARREPPVVGDLVRVGHDLGAVGQLGDEEPGVVPPPAPGRRDPARERNQVLAIQDDPHLLRQLADGGGGEGARVAGRPARCVRRVHGASREHVQARPEGHRRRPSREQDLRPARTRAHEDDGRCRPRLDAGRCALGPRWPRRPVSLRQGAPRARRAR